ncbi:peroxiredoxin-like family protein [Streptomyces sp. NPDC004270]
MRTPRSPMAPGSAVPQRGLTTVSGDPVAVPDPDRPVHLQFRRFAGCPVCNLHLRSVVRRHHEIAAAGVREVVVFHSSAEELRPHTADLPFAVVADPDKRLYREFGVEQSPRALLDPRAWGPIVRAVVSGAWHVVRGREHLPSTSPHGGRLGLPADFLIAPGGQVLAAKHGEHAYDQWSVDELLELAARVAPTPPPAHPPAAERP